VKHKSTFDTATTRVDSTESAKFSAKVGPAHIWNTLDLSWNTKDKKKEVEGSTNINFEDYHVGGSFARDLDSNKWTGLQAILLNRRKNGDYFFQYDVIEKEASLHSLHAVSDKEIHACEVSYDVTGKFKGFLGYPISTKWTGEYKITDDAAVKTSLNLSSEWNLGYAWIHKFNKNLKIGFSHELNLSQVLKPAAKNATPYNFGASV